MKTISNILTKWKLDALSVAGVDVDKITQSVGISRFEIDKDGGTGRDHERFLSKFRRFDLQIEL